MLKYTGHPLVDVGAATIASFSLTNVPLERITDDVINEAIQYMDEQYGDKKPLSKFIRVLFPNSPYVNASGEKRKEYLNKILRGYKYSNKGIGKNCVFCEDEANFLAFRQHIPLVSGEKAFNFFAQGKKGLPVCNSCLLSIQAFPLGSVWCSGKALFVHSTDTELIYKFAKRFSIENRRNLMLSEIGYLKTYLMEAFLDIEQERSYEPSPASLTAYHLTNFGTNADIDIYHLPLGCIDFIRVAQKPKYKQNWIAMTDKFWETKKKKSSKSSTEERTGRNYFYEDIFGLPANAEHFIKRYLLSPTIYAYIERSDQQTSIKYSTSWEFISLFLRKVMNMEKARIDTIQKVADRLAEYVQKNDSRLFARIFSARRYKDLTLELLKADKESVKSGHPLFSYGDFIEIFEESEDMPRIDWSLARDLLMVRMIEQLHNSNWWSQHKDNLADANREDAEIE